MKVENLRSLVGTAGTKVGTFLFEFTTPGIGHILKAAGADFAVLDMEHTGFSFDTVRGVVRYCQAAGLPLVVRVPSQQRHHISRALDTGADGVMVPIVSSVEQAKAVLDAAKYWPDGTRGVALGLAHERFAARSEPLLSRFAEQNARTARKHKKSVGRLSVDAKQGARFAAMGYDFVSIAGDVWLLQQAFATGAATVRNGT